MLPDSGILLFYINYIIYNEHHTRFYHVTPCICGKGMHPNKIVDPLCIKLYHYHKGNHTIAVVNDGEENETIKKGLTNVCSTANNL